MILTHYPRPTANHQLSPRRRHRGQIPLWCAATLAGLFVLAVIGWTWRSTHTAPPDGRTEIVFWNAISLGNDIYAAIHQFEVENPQYKVVASTSMSPDVTGDAQRLLSSVAGGFHRIW